MSLRLIQFMDYNKIDQKINDILYFLVVAFFIPIIVLLALMLITILLGFVFSFDSKSIITSPSLDLAWIIFGIVECFICLIGTIFFIFFLLWKWKGKLFIAKKYGIKLKITAVDIQSMDINYSDENGEESIWLMYYIIYEHKNSQNEITKYYRYGYFDEKPRNKIGKEITGYLYDESIVFDD